MRKIQLVLPILLLLALPGCSGGGGGGGGSSAATNTLTFQGTVLRPSLASLVVASSTRVTPFLDGVDDTPINNAHVNICYFESSGALAKIPGTSTVITGSDGKFTLSINPGTVPANRKIALCMSTSNQSYQLYSIIPQDLLPTDLGEITTVSLDVTTETTLITRMLCSVAMLSVSASKDCEILDSDEIDLETAMDTAGVEVLTLSSNGITTNWHSFFTNGGVQTAFNTWGLNQGFSTGWDTSLMAPSPTFATVPDLLSNTDPTGSWSGSYTTSAPSECAGNGGSWSAAIAVLGPNLNGTWTASGDFSGSGVVGGVNQNGKNIAFGGGGSGASFGGNLSADGSTLSGGWTGPDCAGAGQDFGPTSGSFTGARQ